MLEAKLRVRLSTADAHYGGGLVAGARLMGLWGDVATELLIRHDGDEGLFVAYDMVEFKAPLYAGDYIEAVGRIVKVGNTSRRMEFEAYKVITSGGRLPTSGRVLDVPMLVGRASGTCVVPRERWDR
ncbi:MAG: hotdog domain-containing protein [Bacillota bacterium]